MWLLLHFLGDSYRMTGGETYLCAATARLFRYFWAVITPTNKKVLDRAPGFSVEAEPFSSVGHNMPPYSFLGPRFSTQPAVVTLRLWAAFFSSVALGNMSLEASVKPTTSPSRTLNHALRPRPAITSNFSSSPRPHFILTHKLKDNGTKLKLQNEYTIPNNRGGVSPGKGSCGGRKVAFFQLPT